LLRYRVVDHQKVSAPASDRAAHARVESFAAAVGGPAAGALVIALKLKARENFLVGVAVDNIPHPATEPNRELRGVGRLDDFQVGAPAHHPRREEGRGELGFGMSGREANDQALQLPVGDLIELLGDDLMVPALDEVRPLGLHEGHKVLLGAFLLLKRLVALEQGHGLRFFTVGEEVEVLEG